MARFRRIFRMPATHLIPTTSWRDSTLQGAMRNGDLNGSLHSDEPRSPGLSPSALVQQFKWFNVSHTGKDYHETDRVWIPLNLAA